jgi:hypothetical protein
MYSPYLETINKVLASDLPDEAIANAIQYQSTTYEDQDDWDSYAQQSTAFH